MTRRREPRCSATVTVKGRGQHRCPFAGTWRYLGKWYCEAHYRAAIKADQ